MTENSFRKVIVNNFSNLEKAIYMSHEAERIPNSQINTFMDHKIPKA